MNKNYDVCVKYFSLDYDNQIGNAVIFKLPIKIVITRLSVSYQLLMTFRVSRSYQPDKIAKLNAQSNANWN